jgi:hypothetical protein
MLQNTPKYEPVRGTHDTATEKSEAFESLIYLVATVTVTVTATVTVTVTVMI